MISRICDSFPDLKLELCKAFFRGYGYMFCLTCKTNSFLYFCKILIIDRVLVYSRHMIMFRQYGYK